MSYDLAVWHEVEPISSQQAHDKYQRLCVGDLSAVNPHKNVRKFFKRLTADYPPIDEWDESYLGECRWNSAFDVSDRHVILPLSRSCAEDFIAAIEEIADEHDLVCYDPQRRCVHYPERLSAIPHLRLQLENGTVIDNPSVSQIAEAVASLNIDGNSFAILERTDMTYIQTAMQARRKYLLEYQEGSLDRHYQTQVRNSDQIVDAFAAFAAGLDSWKPAHHWEKLKL